ncbi:MAG: D-alanine--D-alanine ligase [Pedobacter sp.]|nr:MAG: D-alanine--D-alanine ligase [Pedobacter sp.]
MQKYIVQKDPNKPHIWSSATLYSETVSDQREQWFSAWMNKTKDIDQHQAINFHHFAGDGDMLNNLVMLRENGISTVSITSIFVGHTDINMVYEDLKNGSKENISLIIPLVNKPSILNRWKLKLRVIRIRTLNWEYWPMHLVYAPMYLYWLYLSVKARSFFFFSAANPMRQNAGFAMERKSDSYQYLPKQYYPITLICPNGISAPELKMRVEDKKLSFPLIAKPEMGERGTGVKLIKDLAGLVDYSRASNTDFLVQQFITHPYEAGIFYCRLPTEKHGKITGIVGKQFLSVIGDGEATIRDLLLKHDRHLLQLRTLEQEPDNSLEEVLEKDEERLLVPYGNHCRGAKFEDLSHLITDKLTIVIDKLCQQLPAFYFGRLDIKFQNWEELENGNFSVIELNGAASEPTHMYDPRHSIFFAWREIKRHWDMLYQISIVNSRTNSVPLMSTAEGMQMLRAHSAHISKFAKTQ